MKHYSTLYVGMDVHRDSFTLAHFALEMKRPSGIVKTDSDYRRIVAYVHRLKEKYGQATRIVCGYEAGCLGYTLYHQLSKMNIECVILAPTTMPSPRGGKRVKTDGRDAANIAQCLAYGTYSPVHVPSAEDEQVKEFIRMRNDHCQMLKKLKQQILSFCLRHGYQYSGTRSNWTQAHMKWLDALRPEGLLGDTLEEYLTSFRYHQNKLERLDRRIEEISREETYREPVGKLCCLIGVKPLTALSVISEVGDMHRFATAEKFASYLGLVPGEHSSGNSVRRGGITKAGNVHVRTLLTEAAQCYARGKVGYKSAALKKRQSGQSETVIAYADRANERLRRRYYQMTLQNGKRGNVAKTAIARELACFMWGLLTDHVA